MQRLIFWILTIGWGYYTWYLTTIPDFHPSSDTLTSWLLSNGGHFVFFGILCVLLNLALYTKNQLNKINILPLLLVSFYGMVIEFVQRGIPGRSADPIDWTLDTLGALIFLHLFKKIRAGHKVAKTS